MSEFILLSPNGSMIQPSSGSIIGVKTYLTIKGGAFGAVPCCSLQSSSMPSNSLMP